ncbi:hypothetical protein PQU92_18410 [Asticcacaulis sp. BYS171W]|uniref:PPM-type phosphatase domain-containing protein n=1 Tax=Asticcacaulis aquaticus TaxID=2984212 RepID=A0ABT5HYV8_9CAUL|nr:hypothetical protein [Asticcacaulis aquaticus]MDC7685261.1 hypothetical protein [Asticcacaulis aquaticus]
MVATPFRVKSGSPDSTEPDIYAFSESYRNSPFLRATISLGERDKNIVFNTLNECMLEAMDLPPKVLVFDVNSITPILCAHIQRLRANDETLNTAVVVRSAQIEERQLLDLLALDVNHIGLAQGRDRATLDEIAALLRVSKRYCHVSPAVANLRAKVRDRLTTPPAFSMSESLLRKCEMHYEFQVEAHIASVDRGVPVWGYVPIDDDKIAIFAAFAAGNVLAARKQCQRVQSILTESTFNTASPLAAIDHLRTTIAAFGSGNNPLDIAYIVLDRSTRLATCATTCESILIGANHLVERLPAGCTRPGRDELRGGEETPFSFDLTDALLLTLDGSAITGVDCEGGEISKSRSWLRVSFGRSKAKTRAQ